MMEHPRIELPPSYLAMPRWWHEGEAWLAALPGNVAAMSERWRLTPDGAPMHGSNALVVPVRRDDEPLVLRMTPPDDRTADEVRALRFWDGRGTVRLIDADPARGASLLERLDGAHTLERLPLAEAVPPIARLMRRLAVPPPPDAPSTGDLVQGRLDTLDGDWERLGRPFAPELLDLVRADGARLRTPAEDLAVNGDLHFAQVLRGEREPWLAVDPVLLRGDIAYDLARILWTRLDDMATAEEVRHWFSMIVDVAELDRDRAAAWVRFRTVDYWLWGLGYGLTEDPVRCARLVDVFTGM
ncbi:MAG TPA: aminoglycoside phosphotransferase family protein [Thermomicrobiales bacterium]|nr:aminoglycoside phosphotransferase family protein [Thermomicrobiales bacterium]